MHEMGMGLDNGLKVYEFLNHLSVLLGITISAAFAIKVPILLDTMNQFLKEFVWIEVFYS